jgi:putative ABC transport system substrate-binding protein
MRRREFVTFLGGAAVAWPLATDLSPRYVAPLSAQLRRRAFIEGQNFTYYRDFGPHVDLISEYAAELVKDRVGVIWDVGGAAIRAAQQATKAIPIFGMADDMFGEGLVESLARPNGNTTGLNIFAGELDCKRQEILIEVVGGLRRMAALADANATPVAKLDVLREEARAHGVELQIHRIAAGEEIAAAIDTA